MVDKRKDPHPFINIDVVIGLLSFEASAERGEPTEYHVHAHWNADDIDNGEPSHSVKVSREDFLAMLEIAKAGVSVGRSSLHVSDQETP